MERKENIVIILFFLVLSFLFVAYIYDSMDDVLITDFCPTGAMCYTFKTNSTYTNITYDSEAYAFNITYET